MIKIIHSRSIVEGVLHSYEETCKIEDPTRKMIIFRIELDGAYKGDNLLTLEYPIIPKHEVLVSAIKASNRDKLAFSVIDFDKVKISSNEKNVKSAGTKAESAVSTGRKVATVAVKPSK